MDPADLRLEFLDLSAASEPEKRILDRLLYSGDRDIRLPWVTEKHIDEGVELEGSEGPLECDPDQVPSGEWIHHRYDESDVGVGVEGGMEQVPSQQRTQVMPQLVYYPQIYIPPQPYAYPEMDMQSQRVIMQRPMKKSDKKMENSHQQHPFQPVQFMMYPTMYQPFIHAMPVYQSEYHHQAAYMTGAEHPVYPEEQQFTAPPPPVDMVPIQSLPPQKEHEHVCQHAEVTVSPPKKKIIEETVVKTVAIEPAAPVNPPLELVEPSPSAPVVFASPPPPAAAFVAERTDSAPVVSPIPEYANAVRADEPPTVPPVSDDNVKESVQSLESAKESAKYNDYPNLTSVPSAVTPVVANTKTYAQLFTQEVKQASKPLARVPPFDLSQSAPTQESLHPIPAEKATPANFKNHHHDYKLSEDPYTVRLGECLKNYQLDHRAVSLTPRGLTNRSNWCYVNAVLQALIACPSFCNLLKALPIAQDSKQASKTPIIGAMVELVHSFHPLSTATRTKRRDKGGREEGSDLPTGSSFDPAGVYKVLDKVRGDSSFSVEGRQEDAEEFLSCLLNGLNDEMFEVGKLMGSVETDLTNGDAGSETELEEWKVMGPKNKGAVTRRAVCGKTLVSDIFRGQLRSRVQRAGGEHTDNVQPFFTLQLDIEKVGSVKEALDLLVGKDAIDGMTCSKTHQEIEAYRQTTLEDLPLVLILHLKCFDYKPDGCTKIIKTVDFPIDLKIEPKLMSSNKNKYSAKQRCYKLVAVVYHQGKEATKGHYVTGAYHVGLGIWIRYDDSDVKRVPEEQILKPESPSVPYLLYYRRTDTLSHTKL